MVGMIRIDSRADHLFARETSVADFLRIESQIVRRFKNRWTGRFERNGRAFYIKAHGPIGWRFVLDELLHLRWPHIGARAEWQALCALSQSGVAVAPVVAFGEDGYASPWQQSLLITEEIPATISLETLFQGRHAPRPGSRYRRRLIRAVARIARTLHEIGINHRDFYLCHFLIDVSCGIDALHEHEPRLYLIDLHRAQQRRMAPRRWIIKDLAALLFSATDIELTPREVLLFIRTYGGGSVRLSLRDGSRFWNAIRERAGRLYRKYHDRVAKPAVAAQWSTV